MSCFMYFCTYNSYHLPSLESLEDNKGKQQGIGKINNLKKTV